MKNNHQRQGLFIAAIAGVGLLLYSILFTIPVVGQENEQMPTNGDPIAAGYLSEIEFYKQQLESKDLSEADRRSLEAKLAYAQREATQRANDLRAMEIELTSGIRETIIAQETLSPRPTWTASPRFVGLWQETVIPQDNRYTEGYILAALWVGVYEGRYFTVYSGALYSDPTQGMVTVRTEKPFTFNEILSPYKTGALKIISEKNMVLTLETEKKETLYFDVLNQRFVGSPEDVEPTPTPARAYP